VFGTPAPFERMTGARGVDEDAAHALRAEREEVRAVLPGDLPDLHEPQVRLVDEGGGLECVPGRLTPHPGVGERAELAVDERHQPLERDVVAVAPREEQSGEIGRRRCCHEGGPRGRESSTLPGSGGRKRRRW
jgi:hypothetical protein